MPTRLTAEICFCTPSDMAAALPELDELGLDVEVLDWIDTESATIWVLTSSTELDQSDFFDRVRNAVGELGFVVTAGPEAQMRAYVARGGDQ